MSFRILLAFSALLIAKATSEKIDCETDPFTTCGRPTIFDNIPREVSQFNEQCSEIKSHLRCAKEYQDACGTDRLTLFPSDALYEATFDAISDVCEEGTLMNTVATENLRCFNETFGKTSCLVDSYKFIDSMMERATEKEELQKLSFFCLSETHLTDCALRALSENCGKLVEEATLEFVRRSKSLEYACTVSKAKALLAKLDDLGLSEDKKTAMTLLLEKIVEENSD